MGSRYWDAGPNQSQSAPPLPPPTSPPEYSGATIIQGSPDVKLGSMNYSAPHASKVVSAVAPMHGSATQVAAGGSAFFSKPQYSTGPPVVPVLQPDFQSTAVPSAYPASTMGTTHQVTQQVQPLPDAYQMYNFGQRQVSYNSRVPVDEPNHGVMINAEFPTLPQHINQEIVFHDEAVRNRNWRYTGAMMPRVYQPREEPLEAWLEHHAEYHYAADLKGEHRLEHAGTNKRFIPDYDTMHKQRNDDGIWTKAQQVRDRLEREVLNQHQIREFFQDPAAVAFDE